MEVILRAPFLDKGCLSKRTIRSQSPPMAAPWEVLGRLLQIIGRVVRAGRRPNTTALVASAPLLFTAVPTRGRRSRGSCVAHGARLASTTISGVAMGATFTHFISSFVPHGHGGRFVENTFTNVFIFLGHGAAFFSPSKSVQGSRLVAKVTKVCTHVLI